MCKKESNCLIASQLVPRLPEIQFQKPIDWQIRSGEQWAIIGSNGAGKTLLIDTLAGKYALKSGKIACYGHSGEEQKASEYLKIVAFRDIYSLTDTRDAFFQQRWNTGVMLDEVPARQLLPEQTDVAWEQYLIHQFGISDLLDKDIRLLSSGELRKFLVMKALLNRPKVLVLDNPYIGLDKDSREVLNQLFAEIISMGEVQIVLVLSNPSDIPACITHILPISEKMLLPVMDKTTFMVNVRFQEKLFHKTVVQPVSFPLSENESIQTERVVELNHIHIQYGTRTILNDLNWRINNGEKWALVGPNGSGKSTLLSLISGDNPQAYANDIHLFERKRGSGESIWDIKKHIGFISPEMHLHYRKNIPCIDIVGSGFFDTIGLYLSCSEAQKAIALEWMKLFGIDYLKDRSFMLASTGEQRLVLLARVFVKNPDLLILDEPFHGLDVQNKEKIKNIIENFCNRRKTLIFVSHYEKDIPHSVENRFILTKQ